VSVPRIPDIASRLRDVSEDIFRREAEEREATIETARLMQSLNDEAAASRTETTLVRHELAQIRSDSAKALEEERQHRINESRRADTSRRIAIFAVVVAVPSLVGTGLTAIPFT